MYPGITPTKFGRYAAPEPPQFARLHWHRGAPLREVDHEPPVPVLDQEDLLKQGIDTSRLIPGAARVDALGSCTCNAAVAHLAGTVGTDHLGEVGLSGDAVALEEAAIVLYHQVTGQTGNPAQEWPPTDCGSTGLFVCTELEAQGRISGHQSAHGAANVLSLLQAGSVMVGQPWFNAWMEPDSNGFIDGDGSAQALEHAIASGVAGGHETCWTAIEHLVLDATGRPDPARTVIRARNSWSASWGDHGSYRVHLSTFELLGAHVDYKQVRRDPS